MGKWQLLSKHLRSSKLKINFKKKLPNKKVSRNRHKQKAPATGTTTTHWKETKGLPFCYFLGAEFSSLLFTDPPKQQNLIKTNKLNF